MFSLPRAIWNALFIIALHPLLNAQPIAPRDVHDVEIDPLAVAARISFPAPSRLTDMRRDVEVYASVNSSGGIDRVDPVGAERYDPFVAAVLNGMKNVRVTPASIEGRATNGFIHLNVHFLPHEVDGKMGWSIAVDRLEMMANPYLDVPMPRGAKRDSSVIPSKVLDGSEPMETLGDGTNNSPEDAVMPKYDQSELMRHLKFPEVARRYGIEGQAIIRVLIDKRGFPARMICDKADHVLFEWSAVEALSRMTFTPAREGGKPIAVWIQIPINYSLN